VLSLFPVEAGDIYLLCSDGLTVVVDEGKISSAFKDDLQDSVDALVDLVYKNDAPDNVTVIAVQIGESNMDLPTKFLGAAQ
jgi:serine/threonine protein phosphatase PrpC